MNDSRLVGLFIKRVKEQQAEIAESAMLRPESDQLRTGLVSGRWQGLNLALQTLDDILRDVDEDKS